MLPEQQQFSQRRDAASSQAADPRGSRDSGEFAFKLYANTQSLNVVDVAQFIDAEQRWPAFPLRSQEESFFKQRRFKGRAPSRMGGRPSAALLQVSAARVPICF